MSDICLVSIAGDEAHGKRVNSGVASLVSVLKKEGYDARAVHPDYNPDQTAQASDTLEKIKETNPAVVGFSLFTTNYNVSKQCAEQLKQSANPPVILFGGNLASTGYKYVLKDTKSVDYLFKGYSERSISEFMGRLKKRESLDGIRGVVYPKETGFIDAKPDFIDINSAPMGDREYAADIFKRYRVAVPLDMSRSECQGRCVFCASKFMRDNYTQLSDAKHRKSIDSIMEEIDFYLSSGKAEMFHFNSEDILADADYFMEIISAVEKGKKHVPAQFEIRPTSVVRHKKVIERLFSSRYILPFFEMGWQAMSNEILGLLKTGSSVSTNEKAAEIILASMGTKTGVLGVNYFGFPHPDITIDQLQENMKAMVKWFGVSKQSKGKFMVDGRIRFDAFPGNELFEMLLERGYEPNASKGFEIDYKFTDKTVHKLYKKSRDNKPKSL